MALQQRARIGILVFILLALVLAAGLFLLPLRKLAEENIASLLAEHGFKDASLSLSDIGLRHVQIDNFRLTKDAPPIIQKLTLHFAPDELLSGHLRKLNFSGLSVQLEQQGKDWLINGAPFAALSAGSSTSAQKFDLPTSAAELESFPLSRLECDDSVLHVASPGWSMDMPVTLHFQKTAPAELHVTSANIQIKASGMTVTASDASARLTLDETTKNWRGTWESASVLIKGQDNLLPAMKASGTLILGKDKADITGILISDNKATRAEASCTAPLAAPEKAQCRLISAIMPWNKGILSLKDTAIPLNGKDALHVTLHVDHVPVNSLMTMLTGKETLATGDVSGAIPVTIKPDGTLLVGQGRLETQAPGVITLAPEMIPGEGNEIALVRDIMKNLHYNLLSISTDAQDGKKLSVTLAAEGNNPDVAAGRAVKLNVHLNGDLLNFIQQSILSLLDPHTFLKQDTRAKP